LCCSGFFVYLSGVKLKKLKRPILLAAGVIAVICAAQVWWPAVFERLERMTYDWRARQGVNNSPLIATNLGFVSITDESITAVNDGLVGNTPYGLKWPRHIYGRVARELANQGAKAVAFDVLFAELRRDHAPILLEGQDAPMESDDFFAVQMKQAGNVILAAEQGVAPPALFRNAALALGDITSEKDFDGGVLRWTKAFRPYRKWHRVFRQIEANPDYGVDLDKAQVKTNEIILPRTEGDPIKIPLDKDGNFDLADFVGTKIPAGMARYAKPFTSEKIWQMGIVLAAQELKLDLTNAVVELDKGRITLRGANGLERVIPVDEDGYFYINWCLTTSGKDLTQEPFEGVLAQYQARVPGKNNAMVQRLSQEWDGRKVDWHNKLVVIGSSAVGNDLTDRGATPLSKDTLLASEHWNVANSILTGQFVRRSSLPVNLAFIIVLGALAAYFTATLRSYVALFWVLMAATAYVALATWIYIEFRYWLPIVFPVVGGQMVT
jgi:CHASE2 domain-containing sensor protein